MYLYEVVLLNKVRSKETNLSKPYHLVYLFRFMRNVFVFMNVNGKPRLSWFQPKESDVALVSKIIYNNLELPQ